MTTFEIIVILFLILITAMIFMIYKRVIDTYKHINPVLKFIPKSK